MLRNPDLHHPLALAIAVEQDLDIEDKEIKEILECMQDGADYALAVEVAVFKNNAEMAMNLAVIAGPTLNLDQAIAIADDREYSALANQLFKQQKINRLTNKRPPTVFKQQPEYDETKVIAKRPRLFEQAVTYPRVEEHVMPRLSEAIQFWLPDDMPSQEMQEKTKQTEEMEKTFPDKIGHFSALVSMAAITSNFERRGPEYKQRMWQLLSVMMDKNHPILQHEKNGSMVGFKDHEHRRLQERVFAHSSQETLNDRIDRLPNVLTRMEGIVESETAKHYKTVKEHTEYLRKTFGQHTRENLAKLIATEIRLDGQRVFRENKSDVDHPLPMIVHVNPNETEKIKDGGREI